MRFALPTLNALFLCCALVATAALGQDAASPVTDTAAVPPRVKDDAPQTASDPKSKADEAKKDEAKDDEEKVKDKVKSKAGDSKTDPGTQASATTGEAAAEVRAAGPTAEAKRVKIETQDATSSVTAEPPVKEPEVAQDSGDSAAVAEAGDAAKASKKAWSASIAHSFGWGLQTDDANAYSYGQLTASGSYKLASKISIAANIGAYYTLDGTPNDARRLDLGALSVSAHHASLYKDEAFTGLNVSADVSLSQNLGLGLANTPRLPTLGLQVGLSRKVGPVNFSYGLGFSKFFPVSTIGYSRSCVKDRGSADYCLGGYEMSWQLSNSLSAAYSPLKTLHLSAGLAFTNGRSYAPGKAGETTSTLNTALTNRRDGFGFNLSAAWDTPVKNLGLALALSNGRPWRTNGQVLPFFDFNYGLPFFFDTRFAAMSFNITYSF